MPISLTRTTLGEGVLYYDGKQSQSLNRFKRAIFGYGSVSGTSGVSMTNQVNINGLVATDVTGVGTARMSLAAAGYGGDKAIFGYGYDFSNNLSMTNLASNIGVISADVTGVGSARRSLAAAGYGGDKAIFGYGVTTNVNSFSNLVSNTGVVATDTTGVGTARRSLAAAGYGGDKAIFGFGATSTGNSMATTNLVSNTGVVATDTTNSNYPRHDVGAASYGGDKAIFGFGQTYLAGTYNFSSATHLVSNLGILAAETTGVSSNFRYALAAAGYGGDKAIFGYGYSSTNAAVSNVTNLISNIGVCSTDFTGVGTARYVLAAAGFGY